MTTMEIVVIAAINALVTLIVAGTVHVAAIRIMSKFKESAAEMRRLRTMYGHSEHQLNQVVKKLAAMETAFTRREKPDSLGGYDRHRG